MILELPDIPLLPKSLYEGLFTLVINPPDQPQTDCYMFHDKTWMAKADHMLGWSREVLVTLMDRKKMYFGIGLEPQDPDWLLGVAFRRSSRGYYLSGTKKNKHYFARELEDMAKDAISKLEQNHWKLDQYGFRSLNDWETRIGEHLNANNPMMKYMKEHHSHVRLHILQNNHANSVYHPVYPGDE